MRPTRLKRDNVDPTGEFPIGVPAYLLYMLFQAARLRDLHDDRKLAAAGLNLHRVRILAVIRRIESCSMKDLALFTAMDRTTLTRAVDQLVAEDVVERWSSPRDRRRVNVSLTDRGEAVYIQAAAALANSNAAMLAGVEDEDLRGAARVLRQVVRNLVEDPLDVAKLIAYGPASGGE